MVFHTPPTEQQGQYRYDPSSLDQKGPARLFPYIGEDGVLRYILTKLQHNLLNQGRLSQPWSLILQQIENAIRTVDQTWNQVSTLLVDLEVFQSGWFNLHLPPNEQFDANFVRLRREMAQILMAAKRAAQATKSGQLATSREQAQRQRSQFYQELEAKGRSRPVVSLIHEREGGLSDREFARQRLAGQNPMILRQIQPDDQAELQVWANQLQSLANGDSVDLIEAAAANRVFLADYPLLKTLTPADLQPGRYLSSPVALFYRSDKGLEPLLIQLDKGEPVLPTHLGDAADAWMYAKLSVQSADVTHHELVDHLGSTHLAMEAFAIATPRQLPVNHPVYRLLHPHFRFLLAINTRGNEILLGEGAAIDKLMAPTRATSLALINRAYRQRSFQSYALPNDIQRRGIESTFLPKFPYRDDALLLWQAIADYVSSYLQRYYPEDSAVQRDLYLQAWAKELGTPLETHSSAEFPKAPSWFPKELIVETGLELTSLPTYPRIPDFPNATNPGQITSLQQLIEIATQIIFTCGPQHAAVNFSQFDYVGYAPNAPLSLYSQPTPPTTLDTLLPSPAQDLAQIELTFALSGIRFGTLGSSELMHFVDVGDRAILAQFQTELTHIEAEINTRNQQRLASSGVDYPYLLPSRIPNSINI